MVVADGDEVYIALIGDIRGSRELEDRAGVQGTFEATLASVNERLADRIAARLVITTGDEFQGLFLDPGAAFRAMRRTSEAMRPISFHLGIGLGSLDTALRGEAVGMDGPCFHEAREALTLAKAEEHWARARGFGPNHDLWTNGLLAAIGALREGWTEKQATYVAATRDAPTQREVAERFGVSPSVVSESLSAARFQEVDEAETALMDLLGKAAYEQGWRPEVAPR